jgi:hypothetical protein
VRIEHHPEQRRAGSAAAAEHNRRKRGPIAARERVGRMAEPDCGADYLEHSRSAHDCIPVLAEPDCKSSAGGAETAPVVA